MLDIAFTRPELPQAGALVLLVAEGEPPGGIGQQIDEATGGAIARAFEASGFNGAAGKTCTILAPAGGLTRVIAVGLGKRDALAAKGLEDAGGHAAALLGRDTAAALAADGLGAEQAARVALGAALRSYRFDRYRTKEKADDKPKLTRLAVLADDPAAATEAFRPLDAVVQGSFLTRDVVSEPANILNPVEFAHRCEALRELGVEVEVLGPDELNKFGFGALMGVSQGSVNEPRVVVMQWRGAPGGTDAKSPPIAFVGKGVTFDTGGISIKPAGGMEDMKWDMAGAGAVVGLMSTLARRRARANVVGIVGLTENMPSGNAQRPGDVVRSLSGQTIEVINTDAEGRLVLADVLWYCQQRFDPAFMVDLATLTGAIIVGLGHEYGGMFSNDDELAQRLEAAGRETGEKLWRMPLGEAYDRQIKSDIADMKNVGGRPGGSITGAQFIQRFVNGKKWAHLDIAGVVWSSKDAATVPKGATAFGVRLLDRLVAAHYEA